MKTLLCGVIFTFAAAGVIAGEAAQARAELVRTEAEFFQTVLERGFSAGVQAYMAPEAMVANSLALGREAHAAKMAADKERGKARSSFTRAKPLRAEVAASGELGYTWGIAESAPAPEGPFKPYAVYAMIWKRQPDGQWRFIFDSATILSAEALQKFLRENFPTQP
jgi:hypothetical protein